MSLALLTLVVAAASAKWSRDSARAPSETVEPMKNIAASMTTSAELQAASVAEQAELLTALEAANRTARRIADEEHLDRLLARLESITQTLFGMLEGVRQRENAMPDTRLREAQTRLTSALAAFPAGQLPKCREASRLHLNRPTGDFVEALHPAIAEVGEACDQIHVAIRALRYEVGEDPNGEPATRGGYGGGPGGRPRAQPES
ncbi:MAG TPA: hypothetical protein VG266_04515 [Candidatus Dormibacteraeota bacterium]|nr:hypothetical protein [Candidatus Dormibacteraeota bacterium]